MWATAARAFVMVVVVVVLTSCDDEDVAGHAEPSAATPTPTPTRAPSPFADPPPGNPPTVGYVDHYVHIAPDGTRTRLPGGRGISRLAPYLNGFVVSDTRYFEGTSGTALVTDGRREQLEPCTSGGAAVSRDRATLAWATFGCPESGVPAPTLIHRRSPSGEEAQVVDIEPNTNALTSVVGLLDGTVVYNRAFAGGAFITDLLEAARPVAGMRWAWSIDELGHRIAGQAGREGKIGVVVDATTGSRLWGVFGMQPTTFSPRGTSIVASSGRSWSVLDANSGSVRYELDVPDRVYLDGFAWEDEHHLLAVAGWSWRRKTAILRFDAQGNVELATHVTLRDGSDAGYVLDSQP